MAHHQKRSSGRQPVESAVVDPTPEPTSDAATTPVEGQAPQSQPDKPTGQDAPRQQKPTQTLNINDLKDASIQKLTQIAKDLNVAGATVMRKQDLIFQILKAQT